MTGQFHPKALPDRTDPLVRDLYDEMNRQRAVIQDVARRAGVNPNMISAWKRRKAPMLRNVQAVGNVLGLELVWRRKGE